MESQKEKCDMLLWCYTIHLEYICQNGRFSLGNGIVCVCVCVCVDVETRVIDDVHSMK